MTWCVEGASRGVFKISSYGGVNRGPESRVQEALGWIARPEGPRAGWGSWEMQLAAKCFYHVLKHTGWLILRYTPSMSSLLLANRFQHAIFMQYVLIALLRTATCLEHLISCQQNTTQRDMPKFHYIYLAQNLLKIRFPTSFEQKKSRKPGLRQKKSQTCRCLNSITSILLKTCLKPGFRQVLSRKKVGNLVSDKIDLSRHVQIDLAASFRQIKKSGTWSQTSFEQKKSRKPGFRQDLSRKSRKPGFRQVLSRKKVGDLVSDLSATWSPTSRTTSRTTR